MPSGLRKTGRASAGHAGSPRPAGSDHVGAHCQTVAAVLGSERIFKRSPRAFDRSAKDFVGIHFRRSSSLLSVGSSLRQMFSQIVLVHGVGIVPARLFKRVHVAQLFVRNYAHKTSADLFHFVSTS